MPGCHHHLANAVPAVTDGWSIVWLLFLTGLAGSFSHCISMCGPLAMAQMSIRLIDLPADKMKESEKLKAAFISPYYLGKALTYTILTAVAFFLSASFSKLASFRYFAALLLTLTALFFMISALKPGKAFTGAFNSSFIRKLQNLLANKTRQLYLEPYGLKGFILGLLLGLIPCGLVYASIVTAISGASSLLWAMTAMFAFGIATIPGLFISAYAGSFILKKQSWLFSTLYSLIMLANTVILLHYAYSLIMI